MAQRKHNAHLFELAKLGAEVRLRDLAREAKHLIALFPHLRDAFDSDELPVSFIIAEGARRPGPASTDRPGGKRPMSAVARRALAERMKGDWAAKRRGAAKT